VEQATAAAVNHNANIRSLTAEESGIPVRKAFTAKVRLLQQLERGGTWNGFAATCSGDDPLQYEVAFYDTNAFLRHLMVSEWEELLSPKWLREKLHRQCIVVLGRLNKE
jgi:hypothetical protein